MNHSQILFKFEIGVFRAYLMTMERFLEDEAQQLNKEIEELQVNNDTESLDIRPSPEEDDETGFDVGFIVFHLEDRLTTIDEFTNMLRSSFFVSLYSYLESRLVNECRARTNEHTLITFSDLAGQSDLDKTKMYFAKVLRTYFPSDTPEWQKIQNYRRVRNCIVHRRNRLDDKRDAELYRYIRENKDCNLRIVGEEVFLDAQFCNEAYETIETFLMRLLSSK
jgi:hypothetical protein